ncbi:MAG: SCP2 sterol-binding domain-containing protein [Deltaproteobacteria bacterium]|nr:SCP2 sterol-binding domain-containing protein [Deltaproteobacteria bacterium]
MSDLTPKQYFEEKISPAIKAKGEKLAGINSIYEFQITGDNGGTWTIDLTTPGGQVSSGSSGKANCTVTMSDENFISLVTGKLNPQMAFMTGKLKVAGNMGLALKLQTILG